MEAKYATFTTMINCRAPVLSQNGAVNNAPSSVPNTYSRTLRFTSVTLFR